MTSAPPEAPERHRAPALWLVVLALAVATLVTVLVEARTGVVLLAVTLVGAAIARLVGRGRRPEGIAVRSTWVDVTILLVLALGILLLVRTPGV
ncbi:DUF3017 domain-containing protein [Actinotalea subterranea]|uniref:DUF3017 domain-containing protein n=1 Tax=Actinotalea subterranea TaxID=2607497 RepID=UPI0011EE906A|nr:DUF3017 domain-containing protein [Actinotalea subterranea]